MDFIKIIDITADNASREGLSGLTVKGLECPI